MLLRLVSTHASVARWTSLQRRAAPAMLLHFVPAAATRSSLSLPHHPPRRLFSARAAQKGEVQLQSPPAEEPEEAANGVAAATAPTAVAPEDAGVIFRVDLRRYFRLATAVATLQLGWWVSFLTAFDLPEDTLPTVELLKQAAGLPVALSLGALAAVPFFAKHFAHQVRLLDPPSSARGTPIGPRTLVELTPHTMTGFAATPTVVPLGDTLLMPRSHHRFMAVKMGEERRVAHVVDTKGDFLHGFDPDSFASLFETKVSPLRVGGPGADGGGGVAGGMAAGTARKKPRRGKNRRKKPRPW